MNLRLIESANFKHSQTNTTMATSEITGAVHKIFNTVTFPSGFTKREFVVMEEDGNYPQYHKIEVVKDKCASLDRLSEGMEIKVTVNLRGNEYDDKFYNSLGCWKWDVLSGEAPQQQQAPAQQPQQQASTQQPAPQQEIDTDIPF